MNLFLILCTLLMALGSQWVFADSFELERNGKSYTCTSFDSGPINQDWECHDEHVGNSWDLFGQCGMSGNNIGCYTTTKHVCTERNSGQVTSQSNKMLTAEVQCWVPGQFQDRDFIVLRMKDGMVTYWDDNHVARPDAKSIFGLFSDPIEESGIESVKFQKGKNGYAMVRVITTADSITVGVSPDLKSGFYKYQDIGSGNGNENFVLECKKL